MLEMTKKKPLSDQLRQALRDADETRYAIAKAIRVTEGQLCRFLQGGWLTQETMDRLAGHLDLVVTTRSSTTATKPKRRRSK